MMGWLRQLFHLHRSEMVNHQPGPIEGGGFYYLQRCKECGKLKMQRFH